MLDPNNPVLSARAFLDRSGLVLRHQAGLFHRYDGSCYRELETATVRAKLYRYLEKARVPVKNRYVEPAAIPGGIRLFRRSDMERVARERRAKRDGKS